MALRLFSLTVFVIAVTCEFYVVETVWAAPLTPPCRGRPRTPPATVPFEIR